MGRKTWEKNGKRRKKKRFYRKKKSSPRFVQNKKKFRLRFCRRQIVLPLWIFMTLCSLVWHEPFFPCLSLTRSLAHFLIRQMRPATAINNNERKRQKKTTSRVRHFSESISDCGWSRSRLRQNRENYCCFCARLEKGTSRNDDNFYGPYHEESESVSERDTEIAEV